MKKPMLKLQNGKKISLDDFNSLPSNKQTMLTKTTEELNEISEKISLKKRKAVNTPKGQFSNMSDAAKALNISYNTLRNLCINTAYPKYEIVNPSARDISQYFYKEHKGGTKSIVTPVGKFDSMVAASRALGISVDALGKLIKHDNKNYYFSEGNLFVGRRKVHDPSDFHPTLGYRLPKKVMTPVGIFSTRPKAARAFGLLTEEMKLLMKIDPENFYFIK